MRGSPGAAPHSRTKRSEHRRKRSRSLVRRSGHEIAIGELEALRGKVAELKAALGGRSPRTAAAAVTSEVRGD